MHRSPGRSRPPGRPTVPVDNSGVALLYSEPRRAEETRQADAFSRRLDPLDAPPSNVVPQEGDAATDSEFEGGRGGSQIDDPLDDDR